MEGQYRHELKFLCGEGQLRLLEERIRHICPPDSHVGGDGGYAIRSLYFDTYDDRCFYENEAGVDRRGKYRIRIYNGNPEVIHLERKETLHGLKRKEVCLLSSQQCRQLMTGRPVAGPLPEQELLRRFLVEQRMRLLMPKVIVEYIRTPYVYAAGNVRVTFDRNIRSSAETGRFLESRVSGRCILAQDCHILEVKYDEGLPGAIRELLAAGQTLSGTSFSKYYLCRKYSMR
ncbi:MAG: polyphosphate polymerase domain-containing protein [Acetatifactor sp.]|nr:polyphosphate polymerase domain-containing protein [Acetatifactor sp.]